MNKHRKYQLLLFLFAIVMVSFTAFRNHSELVLQDQVDKSDVIGCSPAGAPVNIFEGSGRKMVPLKGCGNYHWKINTSRDSAQFYFDQGINLFYSFHIGEARASFQEAQQQDPGCAMAYWGEALTNGPTINAPMYNFSDSSALRALSKATELVNDKMEIALIQAQLSRFNPDKNADRKKMTLAYKDAMEKIYQSNPHHADAAVLYADALMMEHPRDWYDVSGNPKEGTTQIVSFLEQIIAANSLHPGALHYYVHMVEPSTEPEKATDAADKLMNLLPSVAHMVHMPSHIYIRTGNYAKGIFSNKLAIKGYAQFKKALPGWEGSRPLYFYHNADMQGTNAMMMGNYKEALLAFRQNKKQFNPKDKALFIVPGFGSYAQFVTAQFYLLNVRFGRWRNILKSKEPVSKNAFHAALWQFGQGMAYAKTGSFQKAKENLDLMKEKMKDSGISQRRDNRNRAVDALNIAALLLEGTMHMEKKETNLAIELFNAAVMAEDTLRYSEPEDWRIPSRHFLGQAYLISHDYNKAIEVFETDLKDHPYNFWALNGLRYAYLQQGKKAEAEKLQLEYKAAFSSADVKLKGAIY